MPRSNLAMISDVLWKFRKFSQRLWVRAALITGLALVAALLAPLGHYLPFQIKVKIDRSTLDDLLDILTNSMLTVATFSLSIMVTAHLAADANSTPRAYRLLQQDGRTQTVIATFLGAFVYAVALKIMLSVGIFAGDELALIAMVTVGVIALVVVAILRWIGHLDGLGSVEATMRGAENRAQISIDRQNDWPYLGGRALPRGIPADAWPVRASATGYVQNIAMRELSKLTDEHGVKVFLTRRPGDWIAHGEVLLRVSGAAPEAEADFRDCVAIADRREHGQDLVFSMLILTEIGERALSPGINDPRTAVYATSRLLRLLLSLLPEREAETPEAPNVHVPSLDLAGVVETVLDPIARDGRGFFEVAHAIQTAARDLGRHPAPAVARGAHKLSARGLSYARDGLLLAADFDRIAEHAVAHAPAPRIDAEG
ncbi:Uncharacterized membrane protein [Palleronia marisminoris]|uniref:DUF2254 domain-containing protein n=2 Tax=Palleronia marisminoris TaxID=315423 RepID=A0A1Y5TIG3_9RHOB|nr:Uncharacterized membrane protein [Palleronia marisminoris]SLN64876.1 hypothetical protein PAM7066_03230 [Palleronia marisminoris]